MKKIIIIGFILTACLGKTTSTETEASKKVDEPDLGTKDTPSFNFSKYQIMKGQLGGIKIGMTIKEAEREFTGLSKKETPVYYYGFDGEEPCFSYYLADSLVLALIPKYNTDTVHFIVAGHKNLNTTSGLNPNSTVKDLLDRNPNLTVNQNLENGLEYIIDVENGWSFEFETDDKNQIGEYSIAGEPSKPKRLTVKSNRIMIQ